MFTKDKFLSFYKGTSAAPTAETCYDAIAIALAQADVLTNNTLIGALATVRTEVGRSYLPVREDITEAQANKNYNGRMGNRPNSNDGYIYRGGGFIQLTGRNNYTRYSLASNPDKILEVGISAKILVQYFIDHNVIQACDNQDWKLVRKLVNGGLTGYSTFVSIINQFISIE